MQPAKPAQVVYGTCHVVTERRAHGVEPLRIAKLENGNTGRSVDAETNECAEVCASLVITIVQRLRLQGQDSLFLHHCLSHSNSYDHFANVCASLQKAQRGLHRRRFECEALKWERLHLSRKRKCR